MPDKSRLEKLIEKKYSYRSKAIATLAVCILGAVSMYASNGDTGVGWAIFGILLIWGN